MPQFHETAIGEAFFGTTLPAIVDSLAKIAAGSVAAAPRATPTVPRVWLLSEAEHRDRQTHVSITVFGSEQHVRAAVAGHIAAVGVEKGDAVEEAKKLDAWDGLREIEVGPFLIRVRVVE